MPRQRKKKPTADDPALRRSYLETYAARDVRKRLSRLNRSLGIRQETVDRWLSDPDFVSELRRIDERRMESALMAATTLWPRILEEQAAIAAGQLEELPDMTDCTPAQVQFLRQSYVARAAKRVVMSTRAAELVAKVIGAIKPQPYVQLYTENVERFGGLPTDPEELVKENDRMDEVLRRARERYAKKQPETTTQ